MPVDLGLGFTTLKGTFVIFFFFFFFAVAKDTNLKLKTQNATQKCTPLHTQQKAFISPKRTHHHHVHRQDTNSCLNFIFKVEFLFHFLNKNTRNKNHKTKYKTNKKKIKNKKKKAKIQKKKQKKNRVGISITKCITIDSWAKK